MKLRFAVFDSAGIMNLDQARIIDKIHSRERPEQGQWTSQLAISRVHRKKTNNAI